MKDINILRRENIKKNKVKTNKEQIRNKKRTNKE